MIEWSTTLMKETTSTNTVLKQLVIEGAPEGTVIQAEIQTKGRGRHGRSWVSPQGGLWFSFLIKPKTPPEKYSLFPLLTGVAISNALAVYPGIGVSLKWPNDVMIQGRKVAGILAEIVTREDNAPMVIIGVGINTNLKIQGFPQELRATTTTLYDVLNQRIENNQLREQILNQVSLLMERLYEDGGLEMLQKWRSLSCILNRLVSIQAPKGIIDGVAQDVDNSGALIVETMAHTTERVVVGDLNLKVDFK